VELRVSSGDETYAEVTRNVIIGGVLRSPHLYVEIPVTSNANQRGQQALMTYQSFVIDS